MQKKDLDLQTELNETLQRFYEKYVPASTREYIDDKVAREADAPEPPARQRPPKASAEKVGGA